MATYVLADNYTLAWLNKVQAHPSIVSLLAGIVVIDVNTGSMLSPSIMPKTYGYTGSNITTVTVTDGDNTWVWTYTYSGSNLTAESGWVKQ
jgi:hypothetical protein